MGQLAIISRIIRDVPATTSHSHRMPRSEHMEECESSLLAAASSPGDICVQNMGGMRDVDHVVLGFLRDSETYSGALRMKDMKDHDSPLSAWSGFVVWESVDATGMAEV